MLVFIDYKISKRSPGPEPANNKGQPSMSSSDNFSAKVGLQLCSLL